MCYDFIVNRCLDCPFEGLIGPRAVENDGVGIGAFP